MPSPLAPLQQILPPRLDPATLSYPPTLPVEIALKEQTPKDICSDYGINAKEWSRLCKEPVFIEELRYWIAELRKDGMTFKIKAQLQSIELLKTSWNMIHHEPEIPASVRADLIKFTVRAAGLDGSKDQAAAAAVAANALQINIVFGDH